MSNDSIAPQLFWREYIVGATTGARRSGDITSSVSRHPILAPYTVSDLTAAIISPCRFPYDSVLTPM